MIHLATSINTEAKATAGGGKGRAPVLFLYLRHAGQHFHSFAASADPTSATDQRAAAEEIGFDRHGVKACHVSSGVDSLSIQVEPVPGYVLKRSRRFCVARALA
jgi:hypothetical protein